MARLAADHSPAWRGLAVGVLHVLVLDHLLPAALGGKPECKYVHLLREVTDAAAARQCQLAALVPPATMGHVEQIAGNLEKMPPKSTYFYPKLLSGLVFNPLQDELIGQLRYLASGARAPWCFLPGGSRPPLA